MNGIVSRLSALGKVWLGLAAGALVLIVFGLAAPGSGLIFPLLSLWCNAALFALALLVLRRAGVELDLFHKAVLVGVWAVAALYFFWALGSRTFLYHWDYVNDILKQYHAEAAFAQSRQAGNDSTHPKNLSVAEYHSYSIASKICTVQPQGTENSKMSRSF